MISVAELHRLLIYDRETGKLYWRPRTPEMFANGICSRWNTNNAGKEAGTVANGYRLIRIWGQLYKAHRIVWAMHTGAWPVGQIDHVFGITDDNRFSELRDTTSSGNHKNTGIRPINTSGVIGVGWRADCQKWQARIEADGVTEYLGLFEKLEDAAAARKQAEVRLGFHFNHGRKKT